MIDLQPFCARREHYKYPGVMETFVVDGYEYGTDGVIAVRVKAPGVANSFNGDGRLPRANELPWDKIDATKDWPALSILCSDKVLCVICDGNRKLKTKCAHCNSVIDGQDCWACKGLSEVDDMPYGARIGRNRIDLRHDTAIRKLSNVKWGLIRTGMIGFTFDGGEGIVIPFAKDRPLPRD